jgi:hypothetical protein
MNADDITETRDGFRRQANVHFMQVDKWIGDWCSCLSQINQFESYMFYLSYIHADTHINFTVIQGKF